MYHYSHYVYHAYCYPSNTTLGIFATRAAAMESIQASFPEGQAAFSDGVSNTYPITNCDYKLSDGSTARIVIEMRPLLTGVVDLGACQ